MVSVPYGLARIASYALAFTSPAMKMTRRNLSLRMPLCLKGCCNLRLVGSFMFLHVSLISAPKLETLGCLTDRDLNSELVLGTTVIQKLCAVSFMTEICCVKVLAVNVNSPKSMDAVLDLMICFPCLEKLYIQMSSVFGGKYVWRCNQLNQVKCLDSGLTTVVFKDYRGLKPHVKFAMFFILNTKRLEVMRCEAQGLKFRDNKKFIAEKHKLHQLFEKRASRAGRLDFTHSRCERNFPHIKHVHDLSKTNPFECACLAWLSSICCYLSKSASNLFVSCKSSFVFVQICLIETYHARIMFC